MMVFEPRAGDTLARLVPGFAWNSKTDSHLIVVTMPGCGACKAAKAWLATESINYREVSPCSVLNRNGCYDTGSDVAEVPVLLVLDDAGTVRYARTGFPDFPEGKNLLLSELQTSISHTRRNP
jgi:glutaredoxin